MANLFPIGYESEISEVSEVVSDSVIGYKRGIAFNSERGDFVRNGKNSTIESSGVDSYKRWCFITLYTQRYAHLGLDTDAGIDREGIFQCPTRAEAESMLAREITEALMADKYGRTAFVSDFEFSWVRPNAIEAKFTIHGIEGVVIDMAITITSVDDTPVVPPVIPPVIPSSAVPLTNPEIDIVHDDVMENDTVYAGDIPFVEAEETRVEIEEVDTILEDEQGGIA